MGYSFYIFMRLRLDWRMRDSEWVRVVSMRFLKESLSWVIYFRELGSGVMVCVRWRDFWV